MPLKTQSVEEPALNLTPMIDIVFLLIIFFMVGSEFTKKRAEAEVLLNVQLPTGSDVQPLSRPPDPIVIDVPKEGRLAVHGGPQNARGTRLDLEQLKAFLAEAKQIDAARKFAKRTVIVRGEGEGEYQRVYDVMNACKLAKFQSVGLAGRPSKTTSQGPNPAEKR
ncbi:MAG: ExbD/TolR family protein [Planctomycetaceae bacterium]